MRKYFLFISTLFCFLAAVAGTGNLNSRQSFSTISAIEEGNLYSALSVNYPHTELEVNYHSVSVNSTCRQQGLHNFLPTVDFTYHGFPGQVLKANGYTSDFSFKQYLFHIYPSHNFW